MTRDEIDVAALHAGIKQVAIVDLDFAATDGLRVVDGAPWRIEADLRGLPVWYADAVREPAVRFVSRAEIPAPGSSLTMAREAALLSYPYCCVIAFHRRRRLFHLLNARAIARQADGDRESMMRLARADIVLAPRGAREQRWLRLATWTSFAAGTSIAMCPDCDARDDSAARRVAQRYCALAGLAT